MILLSTPRRSNWILLGRDALKPMIAFAIEGVDRFVVSAISCLLVKNRKLELPLPTDEWITEALEHSGVECLSISCSIAQRSVGLTDTRRDPADRIIIARTSEHGAQLASYDTTFRSYPELPGYLLTGQSA